MTQTKATPSSSNRSGDTHLVYTDKRGNVIPDERFENDFGATGLRALSEEARAVYEVETERLRGIRCVVAACLAFGLLSPTTARATMPPLTEKPTSPTIASCLKWADVQDDDAIYMWGIQESGKSSRDVAVLRLALSCLGDKPPEIVGFGSSVGFDTAYCKKHRNAQVCKKH